MTTVYDNFWTFIPNRAYEDEVSKMKPEVLEQVRKAAYTEKYPLLCEFSIIGVFQFARNYYSYSPSKFSIETFKEYLKVKEDEIDFLLTLPISLVQLLAPCISRIQMDSCEVRRSITYEISELFLRYTIAAYLTLKAQFECSLVEKHE